MKKYLKHIYQTIKAKTSSRPLLWKLMIPLTLSLLLLITGFCTILMKQHEEKLNKFSQYHLKETNNKLTELLDEQSNSLGAVLETLENDTILRDLFKKKDRKQLLKIYTRLFVRLKKKFAITHFYFHNPDRINFLRIHKPEKHGDLIDRFTTVEAKRTGRAASGIEIGPLGTFTLRVVRPVYEDKIIIGYIELGKEIEDALETIYKNTGCQITVSLHKSKLNRNNWESGMKMLGRNANWNQFSNNVLIYSTIYPYPTEISLFFNQRHENHTLKNKEMKIHFNDADWLIMSKPMYDASNTEVGDLITMYNITTIKVKYQRRLIMVVTAGVIILLVLAGFLFYFLKHTDADIIAQQSIIRKSEKQYRLLADNITDVIWTSDLDFNINYFSPSVKNQTGFTIEERINQKIYKNITSDSIKLSAQILAEELALENNENCNHNRSRTFEIDSFHKNGTILPVETTVSFLRNEEGKVNGIIGVNRNITERKKAEEELKKSKEEADAANLAKSEFLANMSHEIRTPMNAVIGLTRLLLTDKDINIEQKKTLQKINKSSQLLLELINDILDYSKIEAGKLELDFHSFTLNEILDNLKSIFNDTIIKKGLNFNFNISSDIPETLYGDSLRLGQVLINLLSNAIKFTEEGNVDLQIKKIMKDNRQCVLRFEIKDTGKGISKDEHNKIFKAFAQGDTSTTRKYGGTGLGLIISSKIIKSMKGKLQLESTPGEGSNFFFEISFDTKPTNLPNTNTLKTDSPLMNETIISRMTDVQIDNENISIPNLSEYLILLAEDNEINLEVSIRWLEKTGVSIDIARDGKEAVKLSKEKDYDLILMDIQMPNMDGLEATKIIRSQKPGLPIIAISAAAFTSDKRKSKEAGMNEHIKKPIDEAILYRTLSKWLNTEKILEEDNSKKKDGDSSLVLELNGFDSKKILLSLDNDTAFYKKMLLTFKNQLVTDFNNIVCLIKDENKLAPFVIHALKGVSSTIGANNLHEICIKINSAFNTSEKITDSMCKKLEEELHIVQSSLEAIDDTD